MYCREIKIVDPLQLDSSVGWRGRTGTFGYNGYNDSVCNRSVGDSSTYTFPTQLFSLPLPFQNVLSDAHCALAVLAELFDPLRFYNPKCTRTIMFLCVS